MLMDTFEIKIVKYKNGNSENVTDRIVSEDPFEIFINGEKKYFCMRMPGMDYELALGLLFNEGIINSLSDVHDFKMDESRISLNIKGSIVPGFKKVYASSGSMISDELVVPVSQNKGEFTAERLFTLQNEFFKMQGVFDKTGGVHACAFYSSGGDLISFAEDVGRHNALDKCMGSALAEGKIESLFLIMLSSRISFEMIRKSYRTGAVFVAGVSAPTSAAVSAAEQSNMTLVGFLRGDRFNVYSHSERLLNL
ncbi:MAG: formate dehydrogenase family accessory protein FdhD [Spirochaetae bacterium HGW-Spirochaetae-5]|nr:MAG: formate dehydrogenase family accessory protein FdhD [Spirochaetae bacterium HGW-Spirochaetae-5]